MGRNILALSPALAEDYMRFFTEVAFCDHADWGGCYCLESTQEDEQALSPFGLEGRQRKARELIANGTMQGYLAYEDGQVVGWCNCGPKNSYAKLLAESALRSAEDAETRSIVCFVIAPDKRGQGIATELLERVLADAASIGCAYVEAYPNPAAANCFEHYRGPAGLYEKYGFAAVRETPWCQVVRKTLRD